MATSTQDRNKNVRVEKDALDELRRAVVDVHGHLYGALQAEASEALRHHAKKLRARGA